MRDPSITMLMLALGVFVGLALGGMLHIYLVTRGGEKSMNLVVGKAGAAAPIIDVPAWVTDPDERRRIVERIEAQKTLEARGTWFLAIALIEIHQALYRYEPFHNDDAARVRNLKMFFDVWAKMPAPKDPCPGRGPGGHQVCP